MSFEVVGLGVSCSHFEYNNKVDKVIGQTEEVVIDGVGLPQSVSDHDHHVRRIDEYFKAVTTIIA